MTTDVEPLRRLLWGRIFAAAEEMGNRPSRHLLRPHGGAHGEFVEGEFVQSAQLGLEKWSAAGYPSGWHPHNSWSEVVESARDAAVLLPDEAEFLLRLSSTRNLPRWGNQLGPFVGEGSEHTGFDGYLSCERFTCIDPERPEKATCETCGWPFLSHRTVSEG